MLFNIVVEFMTFIFSVHHGVELMQHSKDLHMKSNSEKLHHFLCMSNEYFDFKKGKRDSRGYQLIARCIMFTTAGVSKNLDFIPYFLDCNM